MWIELKRERRLGGVNRLPGWREDVDRRTASILVHSGAGEYVDGPYEGRRGRGYDRSEFEVEEVEGIGPSTAEDLYRYLDARRILRIDAALEHGFDRVPGLDEETAADLREHLEDVIGEGGGDG